ncbi:type I phosphodiesterase / nucleotide pyrophosphatase [Opisthorchis viverrini]|uniref:Uncharacterized protein n=2 Tax=Opisthorchis viverrini TaxID=6198 RepID=A0A075AIC3_OPIVI|nr:hypothetical protein T265_02430 [Opisthorchis viverrini]KER31384.1 hypothetical protein T265_02430 [Opisthorchis viverrini]OON15028.1 type I phosphodiesterase / nucleotide pyrophosphatase [Opisthorchis viverrini]
MSFLFSLFVYLSANPCATTAPINDTAVGSKLLLISLDGFRHDYMDKALAFGVNISGFQRIWSSGFRVLRVENEFITRTAPNHFSMVTGQHEETHGIVDNVFFDPELNQTFVLSNSTQATESLWFDVGAEPIWVTNQLHGHRTGVTSWPGSLAPIKGHLPSVHYPVFDSNISFRKSIEDALGWLERDVNLALLYHSEPDATGHKTGPGSVEVLNVIANLNQDLEYLLDRIRRNPKLNRSLNLIVTSDHGMSDVDPQRVVVLDDFLDETMYTSPGPASRVIWGLWPRGAEFTVGHLIDKLKYKHPKMIVYRKDELPARLFYSHSRRIAPVVVYADVGWMIAKSKKDAMSLGHRGEHGYDPDSPDMAPFLLATGPGFNRFPPNHTIPSIRLVDIYPMMCHILGLDKPGPHNGSLSRVSYLLRSVTTESPSWFHSTWDKLTALLIFTFVVLVSATLVAFACLVHCRLRNRWMHLQRRARQRRDVEHLQQGVPMRHLNTSRSHPGGQSSKTNGAALHSNSPEDVQRLLLAANDDDEVEQFSRQSRFYVDDSTLIGMLHDPQSRFP